MVSKTATDSIEILLVEDSPGDVRLTVETLKEGNIQNRLNIVWDGVEAMDYLRKRGNFVNATTPNLILLDLNLPRKDGREVLAEIKSDDDLKRIPVVVLSTSDDIRDVTESYNLHANCYIKKPVNLNEFIEVLKSIESFWLTQVILPQN